MLARVVADAVKRGKRVAWFAHRRELVAQAVDALALRGLEVGANGLNARAPVQVCGVQGSLRRAEVPDADVVVLDEAHHFGAAAEDWSRLPDAYPGAVILGATATPERGDGSPLDHLFDDLIVVAQPRELVAMGHLVPCETLRPARVQPKGAIAQEPVDAYCDGFRGKRNVVFAPDLSNAETFADGFRAKGIGAQVISGNTPAADRDASLAAFAAGRLLVLVNVYVLTEGWDCPATEVITLARQFGSTGGFIQSVGRGLRTSPGKTHCTLIDLAGATFLHGDPLEDRVYSLDGEGMTRKSIIDGCTFCRVCGAPTQPGVACACGTLSREQELLKATNERLERFAVIRRDGDEQRVWRLVKWIKEAMGRGHKWQSSLYRFKGAYGSSPSAAIVSQALALANAKAWCGECKHARCRCASASGESSPD
jgi:superfamily II DNA or RNA helicase